MSEKFVIIQSFDPEVVAEHVSSYIENGWTLHGDLKLQVVATMSEKQVVFTEWEGCWPGDNVGHVDQAGGACEVWVNGKFVGILRHAPGNEFSFTTDGYPNERFYGLKSRKPHTAQAEVVKLLEGQL